MIKNCKIAAVLLCAALLCGCADGKDTSTTKATENSTSAVDVSKTGTEAETKATQVVETSTLSVETPTTSAAEQKEEAKLGSNYVSTYGIWGWVIAIPVVLFVILDLIFDKKSRGIRHFCVGGLMLVWNVYVYVAELNEPTKPIFRGSPTGLFVMTLVASLLIITAGVLRMRDRHKQ